MDTPEMLEDFPESKIIRKNSLDDYTWPTPAIARGSLFIRTYTGLYRHQNVSGPKSK